MDVLPPRCTGQSVHSIRAGSQVRCTWSRAVRVQYMQVPGGPASSVAWRRDAAEPNPRASVASNSHHWPCRRTPGERVHGGRGDRDRRPADRSESDGSIVGRLSDAHRCPGDRLTQVSLSSHGFRSKCFSLRSGAEPRRRPGVPAEAALRPTRWSNVPWRCTRPRRECWRRLPIAVQAGQGRASTFGLVLLRACCMGVFCDFTRCATSDQTAPS